MKIPQSLRKVIDRLSELPSLGPRQATRLGFYLVGVGANAVNALGDDLKALARIKTCERCFFIHENESLLCDICKDPNRRKDIIMMLEKETDLLSMENTHKFPGRYCLIGPIHKTGILEDWQKFRIQNLKAFIEKELGGQAEEIILGFNPTNVGDFQASILEKELHPLAKKISRLGRGLPTGGEIEFADEDTLGSSLEGRS